MLLILSVAVAAASPVQQFALEHPASVRIESRSGRQLTHASGFAARTGAGTPQAAARAFLDVHGAAFGIAARHALVARGSPAPAAVAAVRFGRTIDGLEVFGGDLVVGVDRSNRVVLVNAPEVPPAVAGAHSLGAAAAQQAAFSSFPMLRDPGPGAVAAGWRPMPGAVRAVYRVDFVAREPAGDWRVFVDGETGAILSREDLRTFATAYGNVYEISPAETAEAICPASGGKPTLCASPIPVTLQNLTTTAALVGSQTAAYNCKGANAPTVAADVPGPCSSVGPATIDFAYTADPTFKSSGDDFAAVMAYHHLDKHVTFFKNIDPTLPPGGNPGRALRGSLPALVNAYNANAPFENAFYAPFLDAMVFGQGANADYAYDATVMYHEFTHGVVWAWGSFNPVFDSSGTNWEAKAVNEGTADSMAASETGRSQIGSFLAAVNLPPAFGGRDQDDPTASRTCQGDGTVVLQLSTQSINGVDGEEHDDGEIWNGFFWEVFSGLRAAAVKGCDGACEAGSEIQYKTLQLAAGTSPTLSTYWQTFKTAASTLFGADVANYVDCVAKRRKFDRCDRTVPMYASERKVQWLAARFSPFQVALQTTGGAAFGVCDGAGATFDLYARFGQPVEIVNIDSNGNATVTADGKIELTHKCSSGLLSLVLPDNRAGAWYLLIDLGPTGQPDPFLFAAASTAMPTRPAATAPPTCVAPGAVLIGGGAQHVPPRGHATFTASGGTGTGYKWSFATRSSGGDIDATSGAYTAGPTGNVTDVVELVDSKGAYATQSVSVTAGVSITPPSTSAIGGGTVSFSASGGSGTGFAWLLETNASGASIDARSGLYTAGRAGGVDVVKVLDSLGNSATANVSVTAAPSPPGGHGGGCATTEIEEAPALALLLGALWLRRRARP